MLRLSIVCVLLISSVFAASINQKSEYSACQSMKSSIYKRDTGRSVIDSSNESSLDVDGTAAAVENTIADTAGAGVNAATRALIRARYPLDYAAGTIRADYAVNRYRNVRAGTNNDGYSDDLEFM